VSYQVLHTDDEWRELLTTDEFRVLRRGGTEPSFDNEFWDFDETGQYACRACGNPLFDSSDKFASGCGWPSFTAAVGESAIETHVDTSFGMRRTEVRCARCGSHLGHVFRDGPPPTGMRYCINSLSLRFAPREEKRFFSR